MGKLIQGGKLHSLTTLMVAGLLVGLLPSRAHGQDTPPLPLDLPLASADVATNNGTFWTAQNPDSAPLPFNPFPDLPVYELGNGTLLLDDRTVDYVALAQERQAQRALLRATARSLGMTTLEGIPDFDEGEGGGGYSSSFQPLVFNDSDLYLKITGVTNTAAHLWIHPPSTVTNGVYDLYYATNLTTFNYTNWQWLLRTDAGQTNLTAHNAKDKVGFYRLGPPNDFAATSSMGTNFWLAFCNLYDGCYNKLSLYISSPVVATGTVSVTSPTGILTNGPVLFVSGSGDTNVNGTYVLTNLSSQEQSISPFDSAFAYVKTNNTSYQVGFALDCTWSLVSYDSVLNSITALYSTTDSSLNGTTWIRYFEYVADSPPTNSSCTKYPFASKSFSLTAESATSIAIPLEAMLGYDTNEMKGIHITSSQPVSVFGMSYLVESASTAFTAYPTPLLGTNYCLMSYFDIDGSQFAVVATEDNTTVTISPSFYTITLQQGETYQIYGYDVTGTWVTSDKPIAVFAGSYLAAVPSNKNHTNPLLQEQLPVESWGKQALSLGFAGRLNGDTYRVLAANDNTEIYTNGVAAGTNQAGEAMEMIIDGPVFFQASQPIQVAQFANGQEYSGYPGDPCEILLPPAGHYFETNIVATPGGFITNYLNLIVIQSGITNTLVNNSLVASNKFVAIGSSGYYGVQIPVTNGVHKVTSSQPVGVQVYGWGSQDAYGYFGGVVK